MKASKILELVSLYKTTLTNKFGPLESERLDSGGDSNNSRVKHLSWMLDTIETLSMEKAFRWLGYIQGQLQAMDIFTVEQLRIQSRGEE